EITAPSGGVTPQVTPPAVTLGPSQTQQFSANTQVTWSLQGPGVLSVSGLYTAPATIATTQTATISATNVADSTKIGTATVTLNPPGGGSSFTPIRVHAGGPSVTDNLGNVWAADTGYLGGSTYSIASSIGNTASPQLYQTERWAFPTVHYTFQIPN